MASSIASTFEAFADPTRREILTVLAEREHSATELADAIPRVGRTAVSSHLRILRSAGLVNERREGRYRYYSINPGPADEAVEFMRSIYRSSLSTLKKAARAKSYGRAGGRKWANSS